MAQPQNSVGFWELAGTRRALAISGIIALVYLGVTHFSELSEIYEKQSALRKFVDFIAAALTLSLAYMELKHSGEANEHRARQVELSQEANEYRAKNTELQGKVHALQESIEKKLTKIRVYVNVQQGQNCPVLSVSNLSEFDVWIEKVHLVVIETGNGTPEPPLIGEQTRISRGNSENGFKLYETLVGANRGSYDSMNLVFYVKVVAVGVTDEAVTIKSSTYRFTKSGRVQNLQILNKVESPAV
jgi:hypothetical protein